MSSGCIAHAFAAWMTRKDNKEQRVTLIRQGLLMLVAVCLVLAVPARAQFLDRAGASRIQLEAKDFGYFFDGLQWPKEAGGQTIIFVCWEKPVLTTYPREAQWVRSAVTDSWQKHSRIEFRGWEECVDGSTGIRITVLTTGPRVLEFGKDLDGLKGGMELNFTFRSWSQSCSVSEGAREQCIRSIGVHEFGHAIGFAHEQDRADTPGECAEKEGTHGTGVSTLTPYDLQSVMNYCNPKYSNDGKLSAYDVKSVQQKYGAAR